MVCCKLVGSLSRTGNFIDLLLSLLGLDLVLDVGLFTHNI